MKDNSIAAWYANHTRIERLKREIERLTEKLKRIEDNNEKNEK